MNNQCGKDVDRKWDDDAFNWRRMITNVARYSLAFVLVYLLAWVMVGSILIAKYNVTGIASWR